MNDELASLARLQLSLQEADPAQPVGPIPPGAWLGTVAARHPSLMPVAYRFSYRRLLRVVLDGAPIARLIEIGTHESGLTALGLHRLLCDMQRLCDYARLVSSGELGRAEAEERISTWGDAGQTMPRLLLDDTLVAFRGRGLGSFRVPMLGPGVPDGDIVSDSWSGNAPQVAVSLPRLLWFDRMLGLTVIALASLPLWCLLALAGAVALQWYEYSWWALTALAIALAAGWGTTLTMMLPEILAAQRTAFRNGLLTLAVIDSLAPLSIVCLAPMGNERGTCVWGLKRRLVSALPGHVLRLGETIPCASVFSEGAASGRWDDFHARPLAWATANLAAILDRRAKIGVEDAQVLAALTTAGRLPTVPDQVFLFDAGLMPLGPAARVQEAAAP